MDNNNKINIMKNYLLKTVFILLTLFSFASMKANPTINVRITSFVYVPTNSTTGNLEFILEFQPGVDYGLGIQGDFLAMNMYINLWLEPGFTYTMPGTTTILDARFYNLTASRAGNPYQVSADGNNTISMLLTKQQPSAALAPNVWAQIGTVSIPVTAAVASTLPTSNTYITIRDIDFSNQSRTSGWAGTISGGTAFYFDSEEDEYHLEDPCTPAVANDITANGTTICAGETAALSATASAVPNPTFRWYSSQTSTTVLETGASFTTPALSITTSYFVSVEGAGYCENAANARKEVIVTVNPRTTPDMIKITIN